MSPRTHEKCQRGLWWERVDIIRGFIDIQIGKKSVLEGKW